MQRSVLYLGIFLTLVFGLAYPNSANANESEPQMEVLKLPGLNGQTLDEYLGVPDVAEEPADKPEDRFCIYQCTLGLEKDHDPRSRLASVTWMQVFGSQIRSCECPSTDTVGKERACPVLLQGKTAQIRIPCGSQ